MKKSILIMAIVLMAGKIASSQVQKKYTAGLGVSTDLEKFGPNLKFDYHLNKKFGVGLRSHYMMGAWQDYNLPAIAPYASYSIIGDYKKGNQKAFSIDAIYHAIGNNQDSKFAMRVEAGLGYHGWSQTVNNKTDAPSTDPEYYSYDKKLGMNAFTLKTGIGFEYKVGPGKLFLDIPLYIDIYGMEYNIFSNQIFNSGSKLENSKYTHFWLGDTPETFLNFNIGYQVFLSKGKGKEKVKSAIGCISPE